MKKWLSMLLAAVMVLTTMSPMMAYGITIDENKVYNSKDELYSDMRQLLKEQQAGDYEFNISNALLEEVCVYDTGYQTYTFDYMQIFDLNGDQNTLPADEGDYLQQMAYGSCSSGVNRGSWGNCISFRVTSKYCATLEQNAQFESDLKVLFASGGPLAGLKSAGVYEKVTGCMNYIHQNVSYIGTVTPIYHTAYSALSGEKKATCQGYALLLYRMLRELGITNRIIMDNGTGAHTFNLVLIDGKYYLCDATSNTALKGKSAVNIAGLQPHYQTEAFKANILSRLSESDYPAPHTHSYSNTYSSDASSHWKACACGEVSGKETHTAGDWVVDKAATVSAAGSKHKSCTKCGYIMETQTIEKLPQTAQKEYDILDGGKETTYDTKGEEVAIRADGDIDKFVSVYVDGKEVDKKHYTVKEGSTIIIFTEEFLSTLSAGKHEVTFNFTDGVANANLTVAESALKSDESQTPGDDKNTETDTVTPDVETDTNEQAGTSGSDSNSKPVDNTATDKTDDTSDDASDDAGKGKTNSIIGWIIGGIVVIAIAGGVVAYLYIRKRKSA